MNIVFNKKGTVVFKQNTPTTTTSGGGADSYATLVTTDGRLRKRSGNRGLQAGEVGFNSSWELITRYQDTIFNAYRSDMKVDIDGVRYTVQSCDKIDEKRFWLRFDLTKDG